MSELSNFQLNSVDRNGNDIRIECLGVDDQMLAHFGGLDLHVKAVRSLIESTNFSFAEKAGDSFIYDKVIALYLNEVGELLRNLHVHPDQVHKSNLELVQEFLNDWDQNGEVAKLIVNDNEQIQKTKERLKEEEYTIWRNIKADLNG